MTPFRMFAVPVTYTASNGPSMPMFASALIASVIVVEYARVRRDEAQVEGRAGELGDRQCRRGTRIGPLACPNQGVDDDGVPGRA